MTRHSPKSAARSQALMQTTAADGAAGAALGLLVACLLISCNLDLREGAESLASLFGIVGVAVAQGAVAAALGGALWRQFAARD